jgi:hypothetical protein
LLRARVSANESQAIGDCRTVVSGLATYASSNCGFYPSKLSCTTWDGTGNIAACIPNYPTAAPQFLGGDLADQGATYTKGGYQRGYQAKNPGTNIPSRCEQTGVVTFCYDAWPVSYNMTGVRSFIATTGGTIYEDMANNGARINCDANGRALSGNPIS